MLELIRSHLEKPEKTLIVFTPNPEQVILAQEQPSFKAILHQADLLLPDGVGLIWASRILNSDSQNQLRERIPGVEVVAELLTYAQEKQLKALILGGREYEGLRYEGQKIASPSAEANLYWLEGYRDIHQPTEREEAAVRQTIAQVKPDLVFVALGAPSQETWIINHRDLLEKNQVRLAMAVGGSFDFLLRKLRRAPQWMRNIGLEWVYRLIQEPWRWRRQLRLVKFVWLVAQERLNQKPRT